MPYIVTTHRHLEDPTAEFLPDALPGISRRAVATFGEAREAAQEAITRHLGTDTSGPAEAMVYPERQAIVGLAEQGGTIGPLPDGTVIEVERMDVDPMLRSIGLGAVSSPRTTRKIIAAYNAAQNPTMPNLGYGPAAKDPFSFDK